MVPPVPFGGGCVVKKLIWSKVPVRFGLGRRNAVTSAAFDSSIDSRAAAKVELFARKRSRTWSHVNGVWALNAPAMMRRPVSARLDRRRIFTSTFLFAQIYFEAGSRIVPGPVSSERRD